MPYPGLLQPLTIPHKPWTDISLDLVEGLPLSESHNVILEIVDRYSMSGYFIGMHHPFIASSVVKIFIENIYKTHGLPQSIVSDRDKIF